MKKIISIVVFLALLIGFGAFLVSIYNSMVEKDESVKNAWGQVENQYQRRMDLIPSLVNTVKGYAQHEKQTLEAVIEARSRATQTTVNADNLTPEKLAEFQNAQQGLSSALSRLMVVIERYPDLKANQNFLQLQAQLEGTENRIAYERKQFNDVAKKYNTYLRTFPKNVFASMLGFTQRAYFESQAGADKAVEVNFEN